MPPIDNRGFEAIRPVPEAAFRFLCSDEVGGYWRWYLQDRSGIVWTVVVLRAREEATGLELFRLVPTVASPPGDVE